MILGLKHYVQNHKILLHYIYNNQDKVDYIYKVVKEARKERAKKSGTPKSNSNW